MRRASLLVFAALAAGCAPWGVKPGLTAEGEAVRTAAREKAAARREAVEAALPLYLTDAARRAGAERLESEVLGKAAVFTGKESYDKKKGAVVEVRFDVLGAALDKARLVRPAGFPYGPPKVLLFVDEKATALGIGRTADSLRRAVLARGLDAGDVRDPLLYKRFNVATATGMAEAAFNGGADWFLVGFTAAAAEPDPAAGMWRARVALRTELYGAPAGTEPRLFTADASGVDVSSAEAVAKALDEAGEQAAARVATEAQRARGGRREVLVTVQGARDTRHLRALIGTLRGVEGVAGAALASWKGDEEDRMPVLRVFCAFGADELAARLLRRDRALTIGGVNPMDERITLLEPEAPMAPGAWER